jgi:hypothetical protein
MFYYREKLAHAGTHVGDRNTVIVDGKPLVAYSGSNSKSIASSERRDFFDRLRGFLFEQISPDAVAQFVDIHDTFGLIASVRSERHCRKSLFNRSSLYDLR